MAYVSKEKKAKIAEALKAVVPAGWRYSLAVRHHRTIVMTVTSAPFDLIRAFKKTEYRDPERETHLQVNPYHYRDHIDDQCVADVLDRIMGALNTDNHDRSDRMTDYYDVGHYVELNIGKYDRPFVATSPTPLPIHA